MNLISKLKQLFSRPRTTVIIVDTIEDVMEQYGMNRIIIILLFLLI